MKVKLHIKPFAPRAPRFHRRGVSNLTMCLPFYRSTMGHYVHRVRYGYYFKEPPDGLLPTRYVLEMWCGQHGHVHLTDQSEARIKLGFRPRRVQSQGTLFGEAPERAIFCATCEGRAIGAGMDGARTLCGRTVMFSPRV